MPELFINNKDLISLVGNRKLYIWGCGHFGVAISYGMSRIGLKLEGFIDSNLEDETFLGYLVEKPDAVLTQKKDNVFIIIASFLFTDEISKQCEDFGFVESCDYITHAKIKPYHFEIDITGDCNLRCLTCPQGNKKKHRPKYTMMSLDNYKAVLSKLMLELPLLSDVQIYSWGEPLLNKNLPEIINYTVENGIAIAISSNLSLTCDLESIIKAKPTWFRVSLSGSDQEMYSVVHRGGNLDLVIKNMRILAELRKKWAPKMFIDVNYHLYKHNLKGVAKIAEICRELDFTFRTNFAFIDPIDTIIEFAKGGDIPEETKEGQNLLLLDINEAIKQSQESGIYDCVSQNSFVINSDLSFRRCTHLFYAEDNIIEKNFLKTPLKNILNKSSECETCNVCRKLGVHRFHFAYINNGTTLENYENI